MDSVKYLFFFLYSSLLFSGEMNGINYKTYKNFDKKWKLVTVRYRTDNEEMRYVYANQIAYKVLLSGKTDFPDGAVIGKIGIKTGHDPLFDSSLVPNGAKRYQLMVKNKKKYKEQAGWGYALFDERGIPFPEDQKMQVDACIACHNIASERGYVFSQIANTNTRVEQKNSQLTFTMVARESLPENILKLIPNDFNFVRVMESALNKNIFQGTLNEIKPILSRESYESRLPAILKNADGSKFSLVIPVNLGSNCLDHGKQGLQMDSLMTVNSIGNNVGRVNYCYIP